MTTNDDLNIRIRTDDQASPTLGKIAKKVDDLESADATIDVKANATQAETRLDAVLRRVKDLDDEDAEVILRVEAGRAEAEVRRLTKLLATVDGEDAVAVVTARDQASGDLQRIRSELDAIDGRTATARVDVKTSGFDKLQALAGNLPGIGGALSSLGGAGAGAAGVATGIGAAAVAAYKLAESTADAVVEVDTLAKLTGASVEETSKLSAIWQTTGADVKDLADVIGQVNGVLATNADLAKQLGINLKGASPQEVFLRAVEALNKLGDSQQRLVLGSQLFGEEGVRQVGGLTARYGDLRKAMEDLPPGLGMTDKDVRNARDFQAATDKLKQNLTALGRSVGNEVVPVVVDLAESLEKVVEAGNKLADLIPGMEGLGDVIAKPLEPLKNWADGLATAADGSLVWTDRLKGVGQALNSTLGPLGQLTNGIFDVKGGMDEAAASGTPMEKTLEKVRDAADDAGVKIRDIGTEYEALQLIFSASRAELNLAQQFDDVRDAAVEAWEKTADGADDAEQAQRDYKGALIDTKSEVAKYAEQVLKLPPEAITKILADIDNGSLDSAEADLKALTRQRSMDVMVELKLRNTIALSGPKAGTLVPAGRSMTAAPAPVGASARGAPAPATSAATATLTVPVAVVAGQPTAVANVTNIYNLPAGTDESRIVGQMAKWQRRNGSLANAGTRSL